MPVVKDMIALVVAEGATESFLVAAANRLAEYVITVAYPFPQEIIVATERSGWPAIVFVCIDTYPQARGSVEQLFSKGTHYVYVDEFGGDFSLLDQFVSQVASRLFNAKE